MSEGGEGERMCLHSPQLSTHPTSQHTNTKQTTTTLQISKDVTLYMSNDIQLSCHLMMNGDVIYDMSFSILVFNMLF